jgi:acyl-coenzyme A thioesterase PaaI-like protein
MSDTSDLPSGFAVHTRTSPATSSWAPIYARHHAGTVQLAIRVAANHCNSRGMLHGGVIATLADNACGLTLAEALGGAAVGATSLGGAALGGAARGGAALGIVTTSLAIDYLAAAKLGQWLQVEPRVIKATTSSGVIDALLTADGVVVARANAAFRVLG